MAGKIPFRFTNPVRRYLETLVAEYEKREADLGAAKAVPFRCQIQTYLDNESVDGTSEDNRYSFLHYLTNLHVIYATESRENLNSLTSVVEVLVPTRDNGILAFSPLESYKHPEMMEIGVNEIEPIIRLRQKMARQIESPIVVPQTHSEELGPVFNVRLGVLTYGPLRISFHGKTYAVSPGNVFAQLWENRRSEYNGIPDVLHKGKTLHEDELLTKLVTSNTKENVTKLRKTIKNLDSRLRSKGFPTKIKTTNHSYLLLVSLGGPSRPHGS